MTDLDTLLVSWTKATVNLKWGVQRVFHDVFSAAADGNTTLIYGRDYRDGKPYLVNTVGAMLTTGGGNGVPSRNFGEVVSLFDRINEELYNRSVNTTIGYVSPLAADIFLHHFAPLKDAPEVATSEVVVGSDVEDKVYVERSDEDLAKDLVNMFMTYSACEVDVDALDTLAEVEAENHRS